MGILTYKTGFVNQFPKYTLQESSQKNKVGAQSIGADGLFLYTVAVIAKRKTGGGFTLSASESVKVRALS